MFSTKIIDSDAFMDMPSSAQNLYFHLCMRADDEGFVGNPKKIMRMIGANDDDIKVLMGKRFILTFETGIVVIKHWLIHNLIRMDRFNPTSYQEEKKLLKVKENKAYTEWQPNDNQLATQVKLSEVKLIKDKETEQSSEHSSLSFLRKIPKEVIDEMVLKFKVEPEQVKLKAEALADYCDSKGRKYKDYMAFLRNALRKDFGERPTPKRKQKYEIIDGMAQMVGYE